MAIFDKLLDRMGYMRKAPGVVAPRWLLANAEARQFDVPNYTLPESQARTMLQMAWVQSAVDAIANACMLQDLNVTTWSGETKEQIDGHPFERLMEQPNPLMSQGELFYATAASYRLTGNAYWYLNRTTPAAPPAEVWMVPSNQIRPVPDGRQYIKAYEYDPGNGAFIYLPVWQICHFKGWHPLNPFVGASAIESLAWTLQTDDATRRYLANFFSEDNAKFPGILGFNDVLPRDQFEEIQRQFKEQNAGSRRALRMLMGIGGGGMSWLQTGMTAADMELLQSREFSRDEIFTTLAPGLASIVSVNATEANALAGKKTFTEQAVWPLLVRIAQKITSIILPAYGDNLSCEFEDPRITDRALELSEIQTYSATHTLDEVREEWYQDGPIGDERGKLLVAQIGQASIAPDGSKQEPPPQLAALTGKPADDAPEDEPQPPDSGEPEQKGNERTEDTETKRAKELRTWRRYAEKHGATKAQEFSPDTLPIDVAGVIKARLAAATDDEEVHAAFSGPFLVKADRTTRAGLVDPHANSKDRFERRLRRMLKERLGSQLEEVMKLLGDPPDLSRLTEEFWLTQEGLLIGSLRPDLENMAREAGETMIVSGVGISWDLVAENAAQWARGYSYGLVGGINSTTRRVLRGSVEQFIREPGRTLGDLKDDLTPYFGDARADMIAVTEVTRAYAQGEVESVKLAEAAGYQMEQVWHTNRDELVCPICAANDGKTRSQGWTTAGPPAHVRCRCWLTSRLAQSTRDRLGLQ